MADKVVQIPGVGNVAFPDTMSDDQISAAAAKLYREKQAPASPPRTNIDRLVDLLPAAGGLVGGGLGSLTGLPTLGVGAVPGAIAGATFLGAGGEAARQLINRARGVDVPATPSAAAADIAVQGGEQGALEGVGQGVTAAVPPIAKAVYRGYLKPSLAKINIGKAKEIVETAFRENLPVTAGALGEARNRIGALKAQVDGLLANAGGSVDLHQIAENLRTWAQQTYNRAGRAPEDLKAALGVADRIDAHPSMTPTVPNGWQDIVDLSTANQVKRDVQEGAASAYGVKSGAEKTAEKMGARGMRQAIETQAPAVAPLNMRESKLIDLARALERATGREENRNAFFGVPTLMSAAIGGEEYGRTGDPTAAATRALAFRIGLHPAVATRAAVLATKIAEKVPGTAVADVARAAVQAALEQGIQ